jgi:hypothetical protein
MHIPHLRNLHEWLRAIVFGLLICGSRAFAQTSQEDSAALRQMLERLDHLEQQNRQLADEIHALRSELAASRTKAVGEEAGAEPAAGIAERVEVQERRIEEHAQTKVESSQHFPIRITGMALFNAFLNSRSAGSSVVPVIASTGGNALRGGATLRQTTLGLEFRGPETFGAGKIHGVVNMDFFDGSGHPYNSVFHLRTAALQVDWKTTSIMFGQDKPLIAPHEPNSLAQVGISPLTGAGNLWIWQPQARVEQRFRIGERTNLRAQLGVFATREDYGYVPPDYATAFQNTRPALQGRFSLLHSIDDERHIEIGSGFDVSTSHVAGVSIPSRVYTFDWLVNPWRKLEFSGSLFRGQNLTNVGGIGQGFTIWSPEYIIPVHAHGGWAQLSLRATPRLTFNLFGGWQNNRERDLYYGIANNQAYAANVMYRLAPNVIFSLETGQVRTDRLANRNRLSNHHDLGFAYLF